MSVWKKCIPTFYDRVTLSLENKGYIRRTEGKIRGLYQNRRPSEFVIRRTDQITKTNPPSKQGEPEDCTLVFTVEPTHRTILSRN